MIPMTLPDIDTSKTYTRSSITRQISEWIFTPVPNERQVTPKPSVLSYAPRRSGSTSPTLSPPSSPVSSISPREINKLATLGLKAEEYNSQPNPEPRGILKSSVTVTPAPRDLGFSPAMFYLSVPGGRNNRGIKQLTATLCESLAQTKNLGGYFSFEEGLNEAADDTVSTSAPSPKLSLQGRLDAIPMTLVHQLATIETEIADHFTSSFKMPILSQAIHEKLIGKFDILFSEQIKSFVENDGQKNGKWNPLEPLVFIVDVARLGESNEGANMKEAQLFVEWLSSRGVRKVPGHVKFLVLTSTGSTVEKAFRERGAKGSDIGSEVGRDYGEGITEESRIW